MPLVSAKCTNCGANLEVDNTKDAAICSYCGTPYIVEKAINYYNTTNNITAEVVNVYGDNSTDFVIRAGELLEYNGVSTNVEIPNSVTMIGERAFYCCKGLISVSIPDSVTSIASYSFQGCSSLKSIIIPASVIEIGDSAFAGCGNLFDVIFEVGLKKIGPRAFSHSGLRTITIPESVESIGDYAFGHCDSLEQVILPSHPIYICADSEYSNAAFSFCNSLVTVVNGGQHSYNCFSGPYYKQRLLQSQPQPQQNTGGCYIATAVYGSYDCPSVWTLRRYRDNMLAKSHFGRLFIRCYYAISPTVVRMFGKQMWFNRFWKKRLDRFVSRLQDAGYDDSPYTDC